MHQAPRFLAQYVGTVDQPTLAVYSQSEWAKTRATRSIHAFPSPNSMLASPHDFMQVAILLLTHPLILGSADSTLLQLA